MWTNRATAYPLDFCHRVLFPIFIVLVIVIPIATSMNTDQNRRANTQERKTEDSSRISKNAKESKFPSHDDENDSMVKNSENHRNEQSSGKVNDDNSAALNRFLEDVLNAQNDFKWIDQTVRNVNNGKDAEKSPSESSHLKGIPSSVNVHRDSKLREKRGSDHNFETMWMANRKMHKYHTSSERPRRVFLDSDMAFKRNADLDALDKPQNSVNEKESSLRTKGAMDDRVPKDWTKTEDICSLSDWLNSNKEPETEEEKLGDRWIRDHETGQGNQPNLSNSGKDGDVRYSARNQRNEAKKEEAPSLETLKETVLELRKSLDQPFKKVHDNLKNVDSEKVKAESKDRRTRDKNKHRKKENEYQDSEWWETSGPEVFEAKRSEHSSGNPDDKNAQQKVWRTKRTEVNNDDVNPRLFYRAGFGEPYLEEKTLKELHDRKRRSKGSPSDEERYSNEPRDENNPRTDAKNSIKNSIEIARVTSYGDVDDSGGKQSAMNYFRGNRKNDEQSDPSRGNLNTVENKLTRHEAKGGNLEGGSSRTFGSATNELRPVFTGTSGSGLSGRDEVAAARAQKTEEQRENTGTDKGEQVIKVSEPQGRLYEDSERTKEVQRIASNERGKLSQQLSEEKRSVKESGNINILLKSEKKNLIKFSNENAPGGEQQPFVLNRFDVKKKLIVENEEEPGKSVSTILKMKIEKARVDGPANTDRKREDLKADDYDRRGSDAFDLGKSKANEELYKDSVGFANELKQRNSAEERLKSSAEFDKGSAQSGEGPRNWYESVPGDQMVVNVVQGAAERCKEEDERDKFRNEEERFRDDAKKGSVDSNDETASKVSSFSVLEDKVKDYEGSNGKKYKEVFILTDGAGDRKINDRYAQRRILQYMEYSNDDVEDADLNYSDKEAEEGENQERAETDEENSVPGQRKQRSPQSGRRNPVKAKLNVMIKEKLDKKKSERRYKRKRRNPVDIIQYYDYDSDNQEQDDGALSAINEQERVKNNNDKNAVESNVDLAESAEGLVTCPPPFVKNNEHEKKMLKEERERERLKLKEPKEQFLNIGKTSSNVTEETEKRAATSRLSSKVERDEEDGSSGNRQPGRLNQPIEGNEEKFLKNGARQTMAEPENCILNVDKNSRPKMIDDFFEDIQFMEQKNDKTSNDVEPLYDELKTLYDWRDDETRRKPRIKGDQRMYYEAGDETGDHPTNMIAEPSKDQIQSPETRNSPRTSDSSPNLMPLLFVHDGPVSAEIAEKTSSIVSFEQLRKPSAENVSQSNYVALKSTDDMFKGGSEQTNITQQKLRGPGTIGTTGEWRAQKVSGARDDATAKKDAASWSLTGRRQYIDTDSRSPYENRKYLEPRSAWERVQNADREKQTVISSRDFHESFVEPLDWTDDLDEDVRVRLGRGLKTIEDEQSNTEANASLRVESILAKSKDEESSVSLERNLVDTSTEITRTRDFTSKSGSETSELAKLDIANSTLDLQTSRRSNVRVKRAIDSSYGTFYDETNDRQLDSKKMDYNRYSKNTGTMDNRVQLSNSGADTSELSKSGSDTSELSKSGSDTSELSKSGSDTSELSKSGSDTSELSKSGSDTSELSKSGSDTSELLKSGLDTSELSKSGSDTSELTNIEIANSPSNLQNPPRKSNARVKRAIDSSFETFYDETNDHQLNSEKMNHDRYSKNIGTMDNRVQLSNSYGNANSGYPNLPYSNSEEEEYDSPADDESHDLKKASRSVKSKKSDKHKKRNKHHGEMLRKQKRKNHVDKSKYSENGRKRRRHKKHSSDSKPKHTDRKKHKKRTSKSSNHHVNVKKSKASRDEDKVHGDRRRVAVDESKARGGEVESENTMIRDGDNQRKRISLLLAADDVEDESQMDAALHGELAGKIVDQIFDQVQKNEDLKASLGPGLRQNHKIDDVVKADKSYQQSVDDDEIKHTEDLMKRVMVLLNRLIYDEVQRKTCVSLSPDLTEFLDWILDVNSQDSSPEQMPLRPLVHGGHSLDHFPRDKFLFQALPDMGMQDEIGELYKKLQLIENLIKEYNALSEKDKTKVQTVHDYMAKQLDQLLEYIEAKKDGEKKAKSSILIGAAVVKPGKNFQYRTEIRNTTSWTYSTEPNIGYGFSPVMSIPNMMKLGNASLLEDGEYFRDDGMDFHGKRRRVVRSADEHPKQRKKHKNRKKRKRKHRKRHKGASAIDQSERKDSVHKATPSRQKRGYLDKDFWESFHSGYEEPLIFTSMDMTNLEPSDNGGKFRMEKEDSRKKSADKPRYQRNGFVEGVEENYSKEKKNDLDRNNMDIDVLKLSNSLWKRETPKTSNISRISTSQNPLAVEEEPITGKNEVEDEVILLNKRQAWKRENEEQLEEVAFGEDMRKGLKDKELFEKLTEIDKEKSLSGSDAENKRKDGNAETNVSPISSNTRRDNDLGIKYEDCVSCNGNSNDSLSDEDKLRILEERINVYSDR